MEAIIFDFIFSAVHWNVSVPEQRKSKVNRQKLESILFLSLKIREIYKQLSFDCMHTLCKNCLDKHAVMSSISLKFGNKL